jgi:transcriptional regulator of acetoin/glycerol metabolism
MEPKKVASMQDVIRTHLFETLELFRWNRTRAAIALDLDRRTVIRMIERFQLKRAPKPEASQEAVA